MKKPFIYITLLFFILIFILGGVFVILKKSHYVVIPQAEKERLKATVVDPRLSSQKQKLSQKEILLPKKFKLEVPFTSQAPGMKAPWPEDFNNACEEVAIIIVDAYIKGRELTPSFVKSETLRMLDFQEEKYGERNKDLEAEEVARLAEDFYDYKNVKFSYDISLEDIRREIFAGNPVILPAAGRKLSNPHYSGEGPRYHMLVAIGWNDEKGEIITNDPGTKYGESYSYKYNVLLNALHEWNGGDVENGRSAIIIFQK